MPPPAPHARQLIFYALFSVTTYVATTIVGINWHPFLLFNAAEFDGTPAAHAGTAAEPRPRSRASAPGVAADRAKSLRVSSRLCCHLQLRRRWAGVPS